MGKLISICSGRDEMIVNTGEIQSVKRFIKEEKPKYHLEVVFKNGIIRYLTCVSGEELNLVYDEFFKKLGLRFK